MPYLRSVAVVGLGYVGLPLAIEFGKKLPTIGFDLSERKINCYLEGFDPTGEVSTENFTASTFFQATSDAASISAADVVIIAVPTPVDQACRPDFSALVTASEIVGKHMRRGAIVVFESTVYPGATEEVCIPALEKSSCMTWKKDFFVGYSPERVNPGDRERTITKVVKVVAGDCPETLNVLADLYGGVIEAGIHRVSSIKVAEASKVIENIQRDLNIALINELSMIFGLLGIDTLEVLEAAGSKWNFLPFRPGLVGGHCIGVDPYYLTYKAEMLGYHPQVILAGRRINDSMATYVAQQAVKRIIQCGGAVKGARVLVLGLTFKENCSDLRNSKVFDMVHELKDFGCDVLVHDAIADPSEVFDECGLQLSGWSDVMPGVDAVIAAVSHRQYKEMPLTELLSLLKPGGVFCDVKSAYDSDEIRLKGYSLWRL